MKLVNMNSMALLHLLLLSFAIQAQSLPEGFVYLDGHVEDVVIELRYYSSNNFIGDTIDGYEANKCIITNKAAEALKNVQDDLAKGGLGIKVFDAYRPQQAVDHFIRWKDRPDDTRMKQQYYPDIDKPDLFKQGYIASRSGHSRGSTVDLTIIHLEGPRKGEELDMGTPWDFFGKKSWPEDTSVTKKQRDNRMLLQQIMIKHGFKPLKEEWWHFTLINEPYPDTYFNFPIS